MKALEQGRYPGLLSLPRELRDQIYGYLLDAYRKVPISPLFPGPRRFRRGKDGTLRDISYSTPSPDTGIIALSETSQQLHQEVLQVAHKPSRLDNLNAELDIMVKGYIMWPTWTTLPLLTSNDATLNINVNLRIFSTESFRENDGWPRQPGAAFRSLLTLLCQFIYNGASFKPPPSKPNMEPEKRHRRINTLSIHVSFFDLYTPDTWLDTRTEIERTLRALAVMGQIQTCVREIRAFFDGVSIEGDDSLQRVPESRRYTVREGSREFVQKWNESGFCFGREWATFDEVC